MVYESLYTKLGTYIQNNKFSCKFFHFFLNIYFYKKLCTHPIKILDPPLMPLKVFLVANFGDLGISWTKSEYQRLSREKK